jgi:predicted RNA binding protein YcfA (HicA-like mRNA interferase family)
VQISREQVIARIKEAGWRFKRQGERTDLYKRSNSAQRVPVPRRDLLPALSVKAILRQAGLTPEQIAQFLQDAVKS